MKPTEEDAERPTLSQTHRALSSLRELILKGLLAPGDRLSELAIVDRLGVSRTPVRAALIRLEEEGLVEAVPSGGFVVRAFSERDIYDAIELRGTLEGLAARIAAERGPAPEKLAELKACAEEIETVLAGTETGSDVLSQYMPLNVRFHALVVELAESQPVARQVERVLSLPFASPSAFVMAQVGLPAARFVLTVAQYQHRSVIEAIEQGRGGRAESLMREHARLAHLDLQYLLRDRERRMRVPGGALIEPHGPKS
jgi:GntR family transcriptional regulator of vanillate catabolism